MNNTSQKFLFYEEMNSDWNEMIEPCPDIIFKQQLTWDETNESFQDIF